MAKTKSESEAKKNDYPNNQSSNWKYFVVIRRKRVIRTRQFALFGEVRSTLVDQYFACLSIAKTQYNTSFIFNKNTNYGLFLQIKISQIF